MSRFKLTIEYAGTRYSGWQIQQNARTVQGELDRAVRSATGRTEFELYGSSRTDAGVHALGQVAHLDVGTSLTPHALRERLNEALPFDISVLDARAVPHRFHARHGAVARRYLYQVATRKMAFAKPFVWWVKEPLDVPRMQTAARAFEGMRDFRGFAEAANDQVVNQKDAGGARPLVRSTLVLVDAVQVVTDGAWILIGVEGSHFLWKMVRRMVGVLVEIGRGTLAPDAVSRFLVEPSGVPAKLTAPPSGLFLESVYYRGDKRDSPLMPATNTGRGKLE